MIKKIVSLKSVFILCFSILASGVLADEEHSAEKQRLITSLMYKSGLISQIESNAKSTVDGYVVALKSQNITKEQIGFVEKQLAIYFNATAAKGDVRQYFLEAFTVDDLKPVLKWLNTPLGKRITQYEEDASAPNVVANIEKLAEPLKGNLVRVKQCKKIDEIVMGTESAVRMVINTQTSMMQALSSGFPGKQQISVDSLKLQLEKSKAVLYDFMASTLLSYQLISYQYVTNEELDLYIKFLETKRARKYSKVTINALEQALINSSRKFGQALLKKALKKQRQSTN